MKHLKNVYTFQKTIKNKLPFISLAAIALGVMSMLGVAYFSMHVGNSHIYIAQAELEFTEFSSNKNILGSVMPASCQSYPTYGPQHWVGVTMNDTFGYCPGTAPIDGVCGTPQYTCAAGRGVVSPTADATNYYWWCGGTFASGNWGADAYCSYPKPLPPSVNIQFN